MSFGKKNSAKSRDKGGFWHCAETSQKRRFMGRGIYFLYLLKTILLIAKTLLEIKKFYDIMYFIDLKI